MTTDTGYALGRLLAILEKEGAILSGGGIPYVRVTERPYEFLEMIDKLRAMGKWGMIADLLKEIPVEELDDTPMEDLPLGSFGIGYYHEKAKIRKAKEEEK